jgi:hypothetical protein
MPAHGGTRIGRHLGSVFVALFFIIELVEGRRVDTAANVPLRLADCRSKLSHGRTSLPLLFANAKREVVATPGNGGEGGEPEKDVMLGWKDEGQADQSIVTAMLGLRTYGHEHTPLEKQREAERPAVGQDMCQTSGLEMLKEGEIRRPDTDTRAYKHVTLSNGMQAVLVSDPEAHSAAAALCVAVGQLDDPECVQGMAHFCEHMLFLGTEKYPEESNFDQFCASAAGYAEHTLV